MLGRHPELYARDSWFGKPRSVAAVLDILAGYCRTLDPGDKATAVRLSFGGQRMALNLFFERPSGGSDMKAAVPQFTFIRPLVAGCTGSPPPRGWRCFKDADLTIGVIPAEAGTHVTVKRR